jgi:hypothetical protein
MGALKQGDLRPSWSLESLGSYDKPLVAVFMSPAPWFLTGHVKVYLRLRSTVARSVASEPHRNAG